MVKTRTSTSAGESLIATGTYIGNGGVTQIIAGIGFQPIAVVIYHHVDSDRTPGLKVTQDGINTWWWIPVAFRYDPDMIISLDADGFTVGDGTAAANVFNVNLTVYTYIAWG